MKRERRLAWTTGLLVALLALLGSYLYLVEIQGGGRRERATEAATHLLPFPAEAATEIVIEHPTERIVCRKEGGHWRITAPVQTDADETTILRLLEDIEKSHIARTVSAQPGDLAAYGLARPVVLTLGMGSKHQSLQVGKANATDEFVFARQTGVREPPILLVDRRLHSVVEKTLNDLREKAIFRFALEDVLGITFTAGSKQVRLIRPPAATGEAEHGWQLVAPLRVRADRGRVERALELLTNLRTESFVRETPTHLARYGLTAPWGSVRFNLKEGHSETLLLGKKTVEGALSRYFARRPGGRPLFTINDTLPADVQRAAGEWREKHVVEFTRADAAELRLIMPQRTVVCAKVQASQGEEWRLAEFTGPVAEGMNLSAAAKMPTAQHADLAQVEDLLTHLGTLQAEAFLDDKNPRSQRLGLMPPVLKVVVIDKAGKTLASVAFGGQQGTYRYATGPHLGGVFLVSRSDTDRFGIHAEDFVARK